MLEVLPARFSTIFFQNTRTVAMAISCNFLWIQLVMFLRTLCSEGLQTWDDVVGGVLNLRGPLVPFHYQRIECERALHQRQGQSLISRLALFSASHWHTRGCWMPVKMVVPTVDILKIGSSASRHQIVVPSSLSPESSRPTSWNVVKSWCLAWDQAVVIEVSLSHWQSKPAKNATKNHHLKFVCAFKEQTNGHLSDFAIFFKLPNLALVYWTLV